MRKPYHESLPAESIFAKGSRTSIVEQMAMEKIARWTDHEEKGKSRIKRAPLLYKSFIINVLVSIARWRSNAKDRIEEWRPGAKKLRSAAKYS